jgi:nucleotide-binding universal stress UspA family protein
MYKKIVVPLDGSPAAECVLAHVRDLADRGAQVILVRVVAKPSYDYLLRDPQLSVCLDEEFTQEASQYLAQAGNAVRKAGVTVCTCVLAEQGPIAEIIQGYARSVNADLIAISAHGRTGLIGRLLGSTAERIVHHGKIPVLMVHP